MALKPNPALLDANPLSFDGMKFGATLKAHGLYENFRFVLRLSPEIHRKIAALPTGIVSSAQTNFDGLQAFSTYLHETIHWWQHIGSTYGFMLSLALPNQMQANYTHLRNLLPMVGFKKSIYDLAQAVDGPRSPETPAGLANIVVNNFFDIEAFRSFTFNTDEAKWVSRQGQFESVGHAFHIAYSNNVLVLANIDPGGVPVIPHPRDWEAPFHELKSKRVEGFYYGSPVALWPLGAQAIFEGQARFAQLQYLHFGSGGRFDWEDAKAFGLLGDLYTQAFREFLERSQLDWPPTIDHPTVALFLLICDMAINPGAGFPFPIRFHAALIDDTHPGIRFSTLSCLVRLKCPELASAITQYTRDEYIHVAETLAREAVVESPMAIAGEFQRWVTESAVLTGLMAEYQTFNFGKINLPIRILFSHFLSFMLDKTQYPEIFCWPGAWFAGDRVSDAGVQLFERHGALFVDREDDDGIFPRIVHGRDLGAIQSTFDAFYAANVTYDMTRQWIAKSGPFSYTYSWLSQRHSQAEMREFANLQFEHAFGVSPENAVILS